MILCPVCQTELLPYMIENMDGEEVQMTLASPNGGRPELVFYCPNAGRFDGHGMNLWTERSVKSYPAKMKRQEKFKAKINP